MTSKQEILIIEDDKVLGGHLMERLEKEGYQVQWARSCEEARKLKSRWSGLDLVIVDVGLPDGSGFDLATEIRDLASVPLVFMTAQGDSENRLRGYELGAEEFIPKPFHLKELLLRIRHVLENHSFGKILTVNEVTVDWRSMVIRDRHGVEERLTFKDYRVLKLLVDSAPRPLSRDEILDRVWGEDQYPSPRSVDNTIVRLRQALKDEEGRIIRSVRGIGYQWSA
jgi:DNA-binding response OmpR family regulator